MSKIQLERSIKKERACFQGMKKGEIWEDTIVDKEPNVNLKKETKDIEQKIMKQQLNVELREHKVVATTT